MKPIKKAGIIVGATIGGVIGGAISIVGHVTRNKFLDDLGGSIVDSTILTGGISGEVASGAAHLAAEGIETIGGIRESKKIKSMRKHRHLKAAKRDLKNAGTSILGNAITNIKITVKSGVVIVKGIKQGDKEKVIKEIKTLGKMATIGAITVGAIKLDPDEDSEKIDAIEDDGES